MNRMSQKHITQWLKDKSVDDLVLETVFDPREDLELEQRHGDHVDFRVKGAPDWGVTYSRSRLERAPNIAEDGYTLGYYHVHDDERVYIGGIGMFADAHDGLIPCFECDKAIRMQFENS